MWGQGEYWKPQQMRRHNCDLSLDLTGVQVRRWSEMVKPTMVEADWTRLPQPFSSLFTHPLPNNEVESSHGSAVQMGLEQRGQRMERRIEL